MMEYGCAQCVGSRHPVTDLLCLFFGRGEKIKRGLEREIPGNLTYCSALVGAGVTQGLCEWAESEWVGLAWDAKFCLSVKCLHDADAGPKTTLRLARL